MSESLHLARWKYGDLRTIGSMRTSDGSRCLVGEEYYVRRCDTADWKEREPRGRYFVFRSNINIEYTI